MAPPKIKKIDSVQNPDTIQALLDAAGIGYHDKFPKKLATKIQPVIVLNDITSTMTIQTIYPVGSIYISTLSTNPNTILGFGTWVAFAEGRYVTGVPAAGTAGGTAGTALTDQENRAVGQHDHAVTDPGHVHTQKVKSGGTGQVMAAEVSGGVEKVSVHDTVSSTTGLTVDNEGAVAGTNAPYIQIFMWERTA